MRNLWLVASVVVALGVGGVGTGCGGDGSTSAPPETCETDKDCGAGWVCRPTSGDAATCVEEENAGEEICGNDIDDDANGAIDCRDEACFDEPACDGDGDGLADGEDNCPEVANPEQEDADGDETGDACDQDRDGDDVPNEDDNCPDTENPEQKDADDNGDGDACDADDDADGAADELDCAPTDASVHPGAEEMCDDVDSNCDGSKVDDFDDLDGDGSPDCVDTDDDGDGVADDSDNCPTDPNEKQADADGDDKGDACDPSIPASLSDTKFTGEASGDFAGQSMAAAGDVDGDGKGDFLVGADTQDSDGRSDAGAAYLVLGSGSRPMQVSLSEADAKFDGAAAGDRAGASVAGAGDVNGDGYADMLVGAWLHDGSGNDSGAAYLVYGGGSLASTLDLGGHSQGVTFLGEDEDDSAGFSVAGVGDVDGDGNDDILVGAPFQDAAGPDSGAAYLVLGGDSLGGTIKLENADAKFTGAGPRGKAGRFVTGLGDLNGDGTPDFAIGSPQFNGAANRVGAVHIIYGGSDLTGRTHLSMADVTIKGTKRGQQIGTTVDAGDFNGDGTRDLVVGAPGAGEAGTVYLFDGTALTGELSVDEATSVLTGVKSGERAGHGVASVPDIDGDGADELLVGAPRADRSGFDAGVAYLVFGRSNWSMSMSLKEAAFRFLGSTADQILGEVVAAVPDLNGDGMADLLMSARGDGAAGMNAGGAFLFLSPIP